MKYLLPALLALTGCATHEDYNDTIICYGLNGQEFYRAENAYIVSVDNKYIVMFENKKQQVVTGNCVMTE